MHTDPELQRAVDRLASRLAMPLVLEDADQQLIVHSPHDELIDDMRQSSILRRATSRATVDYFDDWNLRERREPLLVPGSPGSGVLPRLCIPVRRDEGLLGFLWGLLPEGTTEAPELGDVDELMESLARELERTFEAGTLGSQLLLDLLSPLQSEREDAAARIAGRPGFQAGRSFTTVVCHGARWDHPSIRRSFWNTPLAPPGEGQLKALRPDVGVAVVATEGEEGVDATVLEGAVTVLCRAAEGERTLLAVGSTVASLSEVHRSYVDAVRTVRAARALALGGVVRWEDLGAFRFLTRLDDEALRASIDPRVAALAAEDAVTAETLARYLAAAGSVKQVAEELHIHRATLHQRMERLERFGLDLRSGEDRLAAHLSLMAQRLLEPAD